ncbi:ATP-grasp fold amidoligase family protein [Desulfotalea psychrophila]|nr:ATP-grasp fold amidoligase family protein [Desulfotalea psychrophila]
MKTMLISKFKSILKRLWFRPLVVIPTIMRKLPVSWISDKSFIIIDYFCSMNRVINLKAPKTFNEKIQWLKLNIRNQDLSKYVDKYDVKKIISEKTGKDKIIPTIGVWDDVEDIDFDMLPKQFVIKCTHDSGSVIICEDKSSLDIFSMKKKLKKYLNRNFYKYSREYIYKDIKPRIIAEKYIKPFNGNELKDYKFFCFDAKVKYIQVDIGRFSNHHKNFYDTNFNLLPFTYEKKPIYHGKAEKPDNLKEMIKCAELLSKGFPFVRVDLYTTGEQIYFGELTFTPSGGRAYFTPKKYDLILGESIKLNNIKKVMDQYD